MKRWFSVAIPVLILLALIAWRVGQKRAEDAGQMAQKAMRMNMPATVTLASVQLHDISKTFEATGSAEAPLDVNIAPKVTGRIEYLKVREGDRVRKGQMLVRIDSTEVEGEVQQAMASLAEAQYKLAQAQMTQGSNDVGVNTQIRQQKAGLSSAEADYNQAYHNAEAQIAAAKANLTDAQSSVENAKASVKSAQTNLDNAKIKYDRINGLYLKGFIAAQDVDDAKANVSVQESALEIARGQLKAAEANRESAQEQLNVAKTKSAADIASAKAKLIQSKASLEYAQANDSQKSAYRQSIAALKASVAAAKAALASAKAKRADTVLYSPLDGYVTGRYSDPGAIASPTQPILAVQFMKQIWVSISVPEEVCARIHIGQNAKIRFDAYPDRKFNASIIQINPAADSTSRQFTVRVIMSNTTNMFKPGMFAHVTLETDRIKNAVVVPREAIQRSGNDQYVVVADKGNKAKRVIVQTGSEDDDYISIGDSLALGEKVVVMSATPVKDGQMLVTGQMKGQKGKFGGKRP